MKNLTIFLACCCFLFSCKKENETGQKVDYPLKYVLGNFEPGEVRVFKITGTEFETVPLSGSFVDAIMYHNMVMENDKNEITNFRVIELQDEQNIRIEYGNFAGMTEDTTLSYDTEGNNILVNYGGQSPLKFEKNDDNSILKFLHSTNWAVYTDVSGSWDRTPYETYWLDSRSDSEILDELISKFTATGHIATVDTIALANSAYLFLLEK